MRRLLIIDDDDSLQEMLGKAFRPQYEVFGANTVKNAINICRRIDPIVIVSDVGLPDGSGFDALKEIRKLGRSGLAIIMSGAALQPEDYPDWEVLRIFDIAPKPCDLDLLRYKVHNAVELQENEPMLIRYLERLLKSSQARLAEFVAL